VITFYQEEILNSDKTRYFKPPLCWFDDDDINDDDDDVDEF